MAQSTKFCIQVKQEYILSLGFQQLRFYSLLEILFAATSISQNISMRKINMKWMITYRGKYDRLVNVFKWRFFTYQLFGLLQEFQQWVKIVEVEFIFLLRGVYFIYNGNQILKAKAQQQRNLAQNLKDLQKSCINRPNYRFQMINNYKVQSMKDQFINASLLVNRQSSFADQKNEIIKALESKNHKLKTQLLKILRTIEQIKDEQMEVDSPKKRQSIFQWQDNIQVLTKQMTNSYQKIKMYEYQINKLQKDYQDKIVMKQKVKQLQIAIKEKKVMNERLKQQLIKQQKITQENMRKLQNNSQHQQTELYLKRLNEEASFYKEKIIIFEKKELIKIKNMKKQYQTLKQVQNHLLQVGLAGGELEQLKNRALKNVNNGKRSISQRLIHKQASNATNQEEEQMEDRTREYYQTILGEIKLLQKMKNNHQKHITQAQMEKEEAINKNNISQTKLIQCQKEIQTLEKEVSTTKNKVLPSNLKPLSIKRSVSSYQGQNIQKIEPIKSQQAKSNRIGHLLKFDQIGFLSPKGQRFTDRNLLGKYNIYAKITGIKVFIERVSGLFGGIQVAYDGQKGGEYVKKDKQAKAKQYTQQQYICKENALIKSISGTLNYYSQIQSLSITSSDGTKHKFGVSKTTQKPFTFSINPEQYPTCLFGSLVIIKQPGKKEYSYIQHLGFEIQSINFSTQSSINLMNEQIHQ